MFVCLVVCLILCFFGLLLIVIVRDLFFSLCVCVRVYLFVCLCVRVFVCLFV